MRLDKFLVECGIGSRKEVKNLISNGKINVNNKIINNPKICIDEENDVILFNDKKLKYKKFRYYILNKKSGYVTALNDKNEKTVMELLPDWVIKKDLSPVGRLDKDTEGLLLLTNDGKLNHNLLSPKNHIDKTYYVILEKEINSEEIRNLEIGVNIGDYITMPAKVKKVANNIILLTIKEGKFHQVKRMLKTVNNNVIYLKRISFGKLELNNLALGEVKEINIENII